MLTGVLFLSAPPPEPDVAAVGVAVLPEFVEATVVAGTLGFSGAVEDDLPVEPLLVFPASTPLLADVGDEAGVEAFANGLAEAADTGAFSAAFPKFFLGSGSSLSSKPSRSVPETLALS